MCERRVLGRITARLRPSLPAVPGGADWVTPATTLPIKRAGNALYRGVQFRVERPESKDVARDILWKSLSVAAMIDEQLIQEGATHFRASPIRRETIGKPRKLGNQGSRLHVRCQHGQPPPRSRQEFIDRPCLANGNPLGVVAHVRRQRLKLIRFGIDVRA